MSALKANAANMEETATGDPASHVPIVIAITNRNSIRGLARSLSFVAFSLLSALAVLSSFASFSYFAAFAHSLLGTLLGTLEMVVGDSSDSTAAGTSFAPLGLVVHLYVSLARSC